MTSSATATLDAFLDAHGEELVAFRRRLHAHPELSWAEHETTAAVRARLEVAGAAVAPLATETGLQVDLGEGPGPTILLRADIDALPLDDQKEVPYRSTVPGVCHACGHDVHTTILLGAGLALQQILGPEHPGRVRLLFQPAEESMPGGAEALYRTAVLDDVDVAYALHCDPSLEVGQVGLRSGLITSAADRVVIRLSGPGGHTARPHLTSDLVHIAGRLITDLPAGLTKLTDSRDAVTMVFGQVHAGHAPNVIPTRAELAGTLRVRGRASWDSVQEIVESLVEATITPFGAAYELDYQRGSPPVDNDPQATAVLRAATHAALGREAGVPTQQSVGNEDFSWLLERVPGAYGRLGVRPVGAPRWADLHAGGFDIDEGAIPAGVRLLVHTALEALSAYGG
ncbi:MAG TPA: amidohydrolase [Acidimicrobiales bacterium]|jgi:amidohydrolase